MTKAKKEIITVVSALTCIFLVLICFQYQSLSLDMYGDDYALIKSFTAQELISAFYSNGASVNPVMTSSYRPMLFITLHFTHMIGGFDPYKLHMLVVFMQILQTIAAFLFFRMLTQNNLLALAGSLLFSLNPNAWWHFTCIGEMPSITAMVPFFLSLISLVFYIQNPRRILIFSHCLFAAFAYLTKETFAPLFFLSILTIIFYRKDHYRRYLSLLSSHMIVFIMYLLVRTFAVGGFGGQGTSPDNYSGIGVYFLNYMNFLSKITLFNYYITLGPLYLFLYAVVVCMFCIALKKALETFRDISLNLLLFVLGVYLLLLTWLLPALNNIQALSQLRGGRYEGFLFVYFIGLYAIISLMWINRKKPFDSVGQSLGLLNTSTNPFEKLTGPGKKEAEIKFFLYSCCFLLISGLPMFFFPEGRVMYVTAIGMGAVFASSFFVTLSALRDAVYKNAYIFNKQTLFRYLLSFVFIIFIFNNGVIFKDNYMGSESIYNEAPTLKADIYNYVYLYKFYDKYNMTEQGAYLFNKLVSKGLVDRNTGKLIMEEVEDRYAPLDVSLRGFCMKLSQLYDFQPSDAKIYPIANKM